MKKLLTQNLAKYFLSTEGQVSITNHTFGRETDYPSMINARQTRNKLIKHYFSPLNALRSKPIYNVTANSMILHVFYYIPVSGQALNNNTVNSLGEKLSIIFGKTVELRLIKLHYPYLDRYILAQYIAKNVQNYTLIQTVRRVFSIVAPVKDKESTKALNILMPSHIVGIKVAVSGRLVTERSRPRQTVQTVEIGSFSSRNNLSLVDKRCFTRKNKKGAFTVKVWISQQANV